MATELGEKLFLFIEEQIQTAGSFELSMCADAFTPQEMSYLAGIIARHNEVRISDDDIRDCTAVLRAEHGKLSTEEAGKLADTDYDAYLRQIMEQKKQSDKR